LAKPRSVDFGSDVRPKQSVNYLRAFAWLLVIGLVVVTVVPAAERPVTGIEHGREHFLAFGFVGFIFALAYSQRPLLLMLSAIVFTAALEIIQIPLPTRHARLGDFLTDALASSVGIGFAHLSARIFKI
jgi:VanZ family protein